MLNRVFGILLVGCLVASWTQASAASDPNDREGCKDPAAFTRMPGYFIGSCEESEFNRFEFQISGDNKQPVDGHYFAVNYNPNENPEQPSPLQIIRNYTNAVQAVGGQTIYEFEDGGILYATLKMARNNVNIWAMVIASPAGYSVNIVEEQGMNQDVAANASAEKLAGNISETGKSAVYGIYFDTGRSEIKSESDAAISEIVKLLNSDPTLNLYVVGHTDNVGSFTSNVKLSQARATAVVDELVKKNGIAADRLTPFGAGPAAPMSANISEEGRAKNRRVELVAQ